MGNIEPEAGDRIAKLTLDASHPTFYLIDLPLKDSVVIQPGEAEVQSKVVLEKRVVARVDCVYLDTENKEHEYHSDAPNLFRHSPCDSFPKHELAKVTRIPLNRKPRVGEWTYIHGIRKRVSMVKNGTTQFIHLIRATVKVIEFDVLVSLKNVRSEQLIGFDTVSGGPQAHFRFNLRQVSNVSGARFEITQISGTQKRLDKVAKIRQTPELDLETYFRRCVSLPQFARGALLF